MPSTLARYCTPSRAWACFDHWISIGWHILMYTAQGQGRHPVMERRAKVFMNNRSQAVRLPKEFQFRTDEVFIRKEGEDVILSPRPTDWGPYLDSGPIASDAFMENVEDLPVQERER